MRLVREIYLVSFEGIWILFSSRAKEVTLGDWSLSRPNASSSAICDAVSYPVDLLREFSEVF